MDSFLCVYRMIIYIWWALASINSISEHYIDFLNSFLCPHLQYSVSWILMHHFELLHCGTSCPRSFTLFSVLLWLGWQWFRYFHCVWPCGRSLPEILRYRVLLWITPQSEPVTCLHWHPPTWDSFMSCYFLPIILLPFYHTGFILVGSGAWPVEGL